MALWSRFVNAFYGARMGWYGYNPTTITPHRDIPFGDLSSRMSRYTLAESYFFNTIYDSLNTFSRYLKESERLYPSIRGIENPVQQENDLIVSYTYKGTIDMDKLKKGAMPLVFDDKSGLEPALKQIVKWSNLDQQLGTYVSNAALLGDAAWWIVDDPFRRRVRLELLDPARVKYVERDEVGNVKAAVIEYEREEEPDVARYQPSRGGGSMELRKAKTYTYTLKVDKNNFQTFKDGEPFAFYRDQDGNPVTEWDNIYGFVPLKLAYYAEGKDGWGRNSFFGTARRQIDELNDQVSLINDSIRNVVVPMLVAKGIMSAAEIDATSTERDALRVLYLKKETASIEPLTIPLDIAAATANAADLRNALKRSMPILSLTDIREKGSDLSGTAIENMFGDAISVIENVRKNLDPALTAALQMAMSMGGIQGYEGFEAIGYDTYDRGDMELNIGARPVIDDRLSKEQRLQAFTSIANLPTALQRESLEILGYSSDDIEQMLKDMATEKQQAQAAQANGGASPRDPNEDAASEATINELWARLGIPSSAGARQPEAAAA